MGLRYAAQSGSDDHLRKNKWVRSEFLTHLVYGTDAYLEHGVRQSVGIRIRRGKRVECPATTAVRRIQSAREPERSSCDGSSSDDAHVNRHQKRIARRNRDVLNAEVLTLWRSQAERRHVERSLIDLLGSVIGEHRIARIVVGAGRPTGCSGYQHQAGAGGSIGPHSNRGCVTDRKRLGSPLQDLLFRDSRKQAFLVVREPD
jgi:hypothetical protein